MGGLPSSTLKMRAVVIERPTPRGAILFPFVPFRSTSPQTPAMVPFCPAVSPRCGGCEAGVALLSRWNSGGTG